MAQLVKHPCALVVAVGAAEDAVHVGDVDDVDAVAGVGRAACCHRRVQGCFAAAAGLVLSPDGLAVSGESFVEPDVVPGLVRDVVAPPLVAQFMGGHALVERALAGHGLMFHAAPEGELVDAVLLVDEWVEAKEGAEGVEHLRRIAPRGSVGGGIAARVDVEVEGHGAGRAALIGNVGVGGGPCVVDTAGEGDEIGRDRVRRGVDVLLPAAGECGHGFTRPVGNAGERVGRGDGHAHRELVAVVAGREDFSVLAGPPGRGEVGFAQARDDRVGAGGLGLELDGAEAA